MKTIRFFGLLVVLSILCPLKLIAQERIDQHQASIIKENNPPMQSLDYSFVQNNGNPKVWAAALTAVSGASHIAGTCFVAWVRGYDYNKDHYCSDGNCPVDLTVPFYTAVGLLLYTVSVGTAIPAIVLFKKDKKNTESVAELFPDGSHLFVNGYQCRLGVCFGGLGINIYF